MKIITLLAMIALTACTAETPQRDADVIVIGGGIAGISAALEASEAGAQVLVLDMNSVGGGHAVMAGGLFLVGTPLQQAKGVDDSPDLAYRDIMAWGEDGDPAWVRRYVEQSRSEVHDWLARFGVSFSLLLPAPGETSVPRFHFARGAAVNIVVPLLREATQRDNISMQWNSEVTALAPEKDGGYLVTRRDTRSGESVTLRSTAVVLATGGFENDLERVKINWLPDTRLPPRLLSGAGQFARGAGLELGVMAGAAIGELNRQTIFVTGFPDPRDPDGKHGLLAQNPAAVFVNADGKRFINEEAPRKTQEITVLDMPGQSYWMVFDERGRRKLQVRGAPWLTRDTMEREILGNPQLVQKADNLGDLAAAAGLPVESLQASISRFNALIAEGVDSDFGRFGGDSPRSLPSALVNPPYYAFRIYPMTRKSMAGLVIDQDAGVLSADGRPLPGLFAAGEVTGVAGINGRYGGSGTFLGPSVLTGRIAGAQAALAAGAPAAAQANSAPQTKTPRPGETGNTVPRDAGRTLLDAQALRGLLAQSRPGYWHFEAAHRLVLEQNKACSDCHGDGWGTQAAITANEKRVQLESCTRCH